MFVYYFKNYYNEIIYVGKTKDIKKRMRQHFTDGHLPIECYQNVKQIFYAKTGFSQYDTEIIETLLIDKYKPIYNTEKVFLEKEERTTFSLPDLKWKELYIQWTPNLEILLSKPPLKVYNDKLPDLERISEIIKYNINLLAHSYGLYEYYFGDIINQDFLNIVKEVYQTSLYTIDSKNSDIDEPITDNNEEICTYATVDIRKINCEINVYNFILMLKYHFIFKISDFLYGIPLHSEGNLKLMGRNN